MGWRCSPRGRERSARAPGVVRHVPAAWRAGRILLLGGRVSAVVGAAHRRAVLLLRVADSVSGKRGAGTRWPVCASDYYRDASLSGGDDPRGAVTSTDR